MNKSFRNFLGLFKKDRTLPPVPPESSAQSVVFCGRRFQFDECGGSDQVGRAIRNGSFEPPLPQFILTCLSEAPGVFMDVGANTGIYSILACAADPRVRVKAFEPFPEILKVLEHNIALNDFGDRIAVYPVALSDRSEQVALYVPEKTEGVLETSCSLEASFKGNCPSHVDVRAQTLDSLKLKEPISLVKVDIEGHEHAFLAGGYQTIQKDRPILLVEVLPPAQFQGLQDFLSSSGYRDFRLRPQMVIEAQEVTYDAEAWNHAFVPPERMSFFLKCCEICGLQVQRISV